MSDDRISVLYFAVMKTIIRQWARELTSSEFKVLLFINERTLRFGKATEYIPINHFVHGVINAGTEEVLVSGIGLKRTAIKTAITTLKERDIIDHEPRTTKGKWTGSRFGINLEVISSKAEKQDFTVGRRRVRRRIVPKVDNDDR